MEPAAPAFRGAGVKDQRGQSQKQKSQERQGKSFKEEMEGSGFRGQSGLKTR